MKFVYLLILPVFLFSFELKFNKKFQHELSHDTLSTFVTVGIEDETEKTVRERLDIYDKRIKAFDKVEKKFDELDIRPKYRNASSTPKVIGYYGELRYQIDTSKAIYMDQFIAGITKQKRNRDTSITVSDLSWSVREDTYNVTLDLLRLEALNWGINYSNNLSVDVKKECILKDVDIQKVNQLMELNVRKYYSNETASTKSVPVPEAKQEKIVIYANYIMECK